MCILNEIQNQFISGCVFYVLFPQVSCLLENGSASANPTHNRKFCEKGNHPLILKYSNCDSLTLVFVTNSSDKTLGFQFRYEITSPGKWSIYHLKPPRIPAYMPPLTLIHSCLHVSIRPYIIISQPATQSGS